MASPVLPPLTDEQRRWIAHELVTLRSWLISAKLAELRGKPRRAQLIMRGLDDRVESWPRQLQFQIDLRKYVLAPAQNKINREGILAQAATE